jgi:hypothetical protein
MQLSSGKLSQDLAVVLTKCDEEGAFDHDAYHQFPVQGKHYSPAQAREISRLVEQHMDLELGLAPVVALAKQSFRNVAFFAASALGHPPIKSVKIGPSGERDVEQRFVNPRPRRVEDPFLWTLHRRGYL